MQGFLSLLFNRVLTVSQIERLKLLKCLQEIVYEDYEPD
jgi:hypothetical protein